MGKKKVKGLVSGTARKGKGRLYDAFVGDGEERKRKEARARGWVGATISTISSFPAAPALLA